MPPTKTPPTSRSNSSNSSSSSSSSSSDSKVGSTLLIPLYGCGLSKPFILASSDSGTSWHRRGAIDAPANEWTLAPTDGTYGEILANVRSKAGHRIEARSTDGTISWGKSKVMKQLPEPISGCEGGMVFHPNGKLYFSHPDDPATHLRNKMVIKVSEDKGQTWSDHVEIWGPHSGCKLEDGCVPAASYSSMAVLDAGDKDSEVGLLFMRNNKTMLIFEGTPAYTTFKP